MQVILILIIVTLAAALFPCPAIKPRQRRATNRRTTPGTTG